MKHIIPSMYVILIFVMLMSCTTSYESKGESAYKAAQRSQGYEKRKLMKEAYVYFNLAKNAHPNKVSPTLKNRLIETSLARAELILSEGSAQMQAINLIIDDIDNALTTDVSTTLKDQYATFLAAYADSAFTKKKLYKGMKILEKAISIAANKAPYEAKKNEKIENFAKENFEAAEIEFVNGKTNSDPEALVRAEFYLNAALLNDKNYKPALDMLSEVLKLNKGTYSAYDAVVYDKPDTTIFDQVNKYDILLAAPKISDQNGSAYLEVNMYNYSYNPLRMKPQNFYIVDANGNKFFALRNSRFEKEILEQKNEQKIRLYFRKSYAPIKKLVFETEDKDHFTEKVFF